MHVLVIDDLHPVFFEILRDSGVSVDYRPEISEAEILTIIGNYDGLVVRSKIFVGREIFMKAEKLRFVGRAGSGMDNIDEATAAARGVTLINVPEANANAVAEHALALLLNLIRNVSKSYDEVKKGKWIREENRGIELSGLKVGIIGYGHTGRCFASKLIALGCNVLAYDKYKIGFSSEGVREVSLHELQREAQVLSFHVPLTAETRAYFNDHFLDSIVNKVVLLNTSRGPVVEMEALINGLEHGKIRAAGLDVLENEKLDRLSEKEFQNLSNLSKNPHVLITSHIAGWTTESYRKIAEQMAIKIRNLASRVI